MTAPAETRHGPAPPKIGVGTLLVRRVFLVYVAAALPIMAVQIADTVDEVRAGIAREVDIPAQAFRRPLAAALRSRDPREIDAVVSEMARLPAIAGVRVVDAATGEVLARSGTVAPDGPRADPSSEVCEIRSFPVVTDDAEPETLGTAFLYAHSSLTMQRLWRPIGMIVGGGLLEAAILWWLGLFFLRRLVQLPLGRLTRAVRAFDPASDRPGPAIGPIEATRTEFSVFADALSDLAERDAAARRLHREAMRSDMAEEVASLGHWSFDGASGRGRLSRQMRLMTLPERTDPAAVSLADWPGLWHEEDRAAAVAALDGVLGRGEEFVAEWRLADGPPPRHMLVRGKAEVDAAGAVVGAFGVAFDITERHDFEENLRRLALTDSLTGLANRRAVMGALGRALAQAERHGEPLSVLVLDCDRFKSINDRFGHEAGDAVLVDLARVMTRICRAGDLPGRIGGEEFLIALPATPLAGAQAFADRLREAIDAHVVETRQGAVRCTVSIGVATREAEGEDATRLVAAADAAMYAAKRAGRNRTEAAPAAASPLASAPE